MRKKQSKKRDLIPDPKFNDQLVTRFVNNLMQQGKKSTAYKIFYDAPQGREIALHAHNDWIELLGEIGAIGSFIFLLILITYFKKIKQNINQSREFLRFFFIISLLTIIFVQSFFDYSLHIPGISILIVVILSIGLVFFKNKNT